MPTSIDRAYNFVDAILERRQRTLLIFIIILNFYLPDDNFFVLSNLTDIAEDNVKVVQMLHFSLDKMENTCGKGENTGYQCVLFFFPLYFQKHVFSGLHGYEHFQRFFHYVLAYSVFFSTMF